MTVATDSNTQLFRDFVACINDDELDKLDDLLTANFHSHPDGWENPKAESKALAECRAAFPDLRYDIEWVFADVADVGCVGTLSGTHSGAEFLGVPASGRRFEVRIADMARIEDGRIAERWTVFERQSMLNQLGVPLPTNDVDADEAEKLIQDYTDFMDDLNTPDMANLERWLTPTYASHSFPEQPGPDGERAIIRSFKQSFPNFEYDTKVVLTDGQTVVSLGGVSGTHQGDYMGHPGTGKSFQALTVDFTFTENGRFAAHRGVFENPLVNEQLGLDV